MTWDLCVQTSWEDEHRSVRLNRRSFQVPLYLFLLSNLLFWFGHNLLLLSEDHLDVAGRAHVGVDATVGAVGASPHLGGLVDLDVLDDKGIHIETLFTK